MTLFEAYQGEHMTNQDENTIYRNCFDEVKGNCPYMVKNEYGTACCSIDNICQVDWYGCTPSAVIKKETENL